MVKTNIQTFSGEVEILSNLHVGPSGSSYLTANGAASNVLDITGNVGATFFVGDGGFLSNIATTLSDIVNQGNVSANVLQFNSTSDYSGVGLVTSSNVGIQNTAPSHTLSIGDKIRVNNNTDESAGESVIEVDGRILATRFKGDGGLLSNIATTFESIVNQGNVASNVVKFSSASGYGGVGVITDSNVGIQNTAPTHNLSIGSNVHVNDTGANVLTIHGNVVASNINMGVFSIVPAYGLNDVCSTSNGTTNVVQFQNGTTSLVASSNITASGNITAQTIISTANVEITDRLKFDGNVFVDTLRVADVAANIVTYDRTTGELLDSSGTFMNKFAVVSEQPPSDFFANTTTVTNHGSYTLTTSNLATNSNTYNAFDGTANAWVSGGLAGGYIGGSNVFLETNLTQLSNLHPTQRGDWLAIEFPYKTTLRHMKLTPLTAAQFPASANLYATNNDLTWSEVKYWKDVNPVTASNVQTITVNATEQFKKYALVATKAAGNSSNVALQDWQLFTESFSIDGGKVAMAQQAATGGETVMDQHGPHGRDGAAKLKKYPEIAFDASKVDGNDSTNTYVQAGYTVSSSRQSTSSGAANFRPYTAFDGLDKLAAKNEFWLTGNFYTGTGTTGTNGDADQNATLFNSRRGEWIQLETPNKIKVNKFIIKSRTYDSISPRDHPKSGYLYASNNGTDWQEIKSFTNLVYAGVSPATSGSVNESHGTVSVDVNSTDYYRYFRLQVTQRVANTFWSGSADTNITFLSLGELEYYGYEEDPPLGDTSVDTTFTSIMNTPQTTGANVYVDGNLGETFTNRVPGLLDSNISNTHTTYVSAGKYWELSGNVESNVTVEANTFLEGDQPHAVSVWFNSSNLEANVSNTCVFSISDQEKLDSVNLDLQSNTWHNLTYAYQGEGGSRVTYLDGRKVAEDQAEDTFGEYPPFAMTGYSQGGYVVSASNFQDGLYYPWEAFDKSGDSVGWFSDNLGNYNGTNGAVTTSSTVRLAPETEKGEWLQIEFPSNFNLNYFVLYSQSDSPTINTPDNFILYAKKNSSDTWTSLGTYTGTAAGQSAAGYTGTVDGSEVYKYFAIVVTKRFQSSGANGVAIRELKLYGHRENDLVRLPDPTNVLKYPHFYFGNKTTDTAPARRGYVISSSGEYQNGADSNHRMWRPFHDLSGDGSWLTDDNPATFDNASPGSAATSANFLGGITGVSGNRNGPWLKLELPHKIKFSHAHIYKRGHPSLNPGIKTGYIYGSNNDSTWTTIGTINESSPSYTTTTPLIVTSTDTTNAYKYIVIQVTLMDQQNTVFGLGQLEYYGTEENSSIPIQIGGGNIDKVANFRVYDKFVGEDQALEIWDAQKDAFGRAKSSMTLQKGRLGIGTTEPEGRLAVADEPHNLEEFPPRAMTGYKNYFEGHGEFCVNSTSNHTSSGGWHPYYAFDKSYYLSGTRNTWESGNNDYASAAPHNYTGSFSLGGYLGEYIDLKMPYSIKLSKYSVSILGSWSGYAPKDFMILASNDSTTWDQIHSVSGQTWEGVSGVTQTIDYNVNDTKYYNHFALLTTALFGANRRVNIEEIKFFGTREQGQSVLHDGQLTLTKSLTVPRIGPALDADDTPRRDRLVVEYNTSTNPTFEGAVRDTSGRGLDGALIGGATYDATGKAFEFPNNPAANSSPVSGKDSIITYGIPGSHLNTQMTVSTWVRLDSQAAWEQIWGIGSSSTALQHSILFVSNSALSYQSEGGGGAVNYPYTYTGMNHVTLVRNSATFNDVTFYVNGSVIGSSSTSGTGTMIQPDNIKLTIGGAIAQNHYWLDGAISNFKLYDTALTAQEVKTLYDMGRCDEGHHVVNFSKTRVGIGLGDGEAPRGALDVRGETPFIGPGLVIHQAASGNWGTQGDPANMNGLLLTMEGETGLTTGSGYWNIATQAIGSSSLLFAHRGKSTAYINAGDSNNALDFTGQHRTFIKDVPFSQASDLEGLIVSSDQNKYIKLSGGIEAGSNAIMINESLPLVSLSTTTNDKRCFGVISASEDPENRSDSYGSFVTPFDKEKGDTRVYINSVGEGAIWVVNTNGSLEAGDYITTSNVAGYGQKQDDDILHNYTVAKITMDCDFNPATQPVQQILRSNVVETYYLGNVHHTKTVPHEFVTTTVTADDAWSNVSINPSDTTYAEWSNLEANTQNTYTLTYTQTSNVVYDTKYTLTTTANVTESDAWDRVSIDPPGVTYAEYSNLEANTQSSYSLTFTKTTTDEKTPGAWSNLESNTQSLYNMVYYQSVEEEVAATWPGATTHTRVTDVIENELDAHGQIQWEDHATETEKAYKIRYLDASGVETDSANAVHIAAFVGCTYHCG